MAEIVTMHAMYRWLERVEMLDVDCVRAGLAAIDECRPGDIKEHQIVDWLLAETGRFRGDLTAMIVAPGVKDAISAGAHRIRLANGAVLTAETGRIITVTTGPLAYRSIKRKGQRKRAPTSREKYQRMKGALT